jgi:hypothetical protein
VCCKESNFFFLDDFDFEIEPLKMGVSVGIRSHINIIMTVFDSGNNFQVTHGKTGIKSNVGLGMTDLIIKPVKDNV